MPRKKSSLEYIYIIYGLQYYNFHRTKTSSGNFSGEQFIANVCLKTEEEADHYCRLNNDIKRGLMFWWQKVMVGRVVDYPKKRAT